MFLAVEMAANDALCISFLVMMSMFVCCCICECSVHLYVFLHSPRGKLHHCVGVNQIYHSFIRSYIFERYCHHSRYISTRN